LADLRTLAAKRRELAAAETVAPEPEPEPEVASSPSSSTMAPPPARTPRTPTSTAPTGLPADFFGSSSSSSSSSGSTNVSLSSTPPSSGLIAANYGDDDDDDNDNKNDVPTTSSTTDNEIPADYDGDPDEYEDWLEQQRAIKHATAIANAEHAALPLTAAQKFAALEKEEEARATNGSQSSSAVVAQPDEEPEEPESVLGVGGVALPSDFFGASKPKAAPTPAIVSAAPTGTAAATAGGDDNKKNTRSKVATVVTPSTGAIRSVAPSDGSGLISNVTPATTANVSRVSNAPVKRTPAVNKAFREFEESLAKQERISAELVWYHCISLSSHDCTI
jgi:hypothetical protein